MRRMLPFLALALLAAGCRQPEEGMPPLPSPPRLGRLAAPVPPLLQGNYLPAAAFVEKWDLSFNLAPGSRYATLASDRGDRELFCCLGRPTAILDGTLVRLSSPVEMRGGELMLPAELVVCAERAWAASKAASVKAAVPATVPKPMSRGRIVVDPGHGGALTGAQGPGGTLEKDVNLGTARRLKHLLEERGYEVVLLRNSDRAFFPASLAGAAYLDQQRADLAERVRLSNQARPDAFVSLHANWVAKDGIAGFEIYYPRAPEAAPKPRRRLGWEAMAGEPRGADLTGRGERRWRASSDLAEAVRRAMAGALSTPDRGARMADFKVIKESSAPAILVEAGYLSNREEERRLVSGAYQQRIAEAVAEGLDAFLSRRGR